MYEEAEDSCTKALEFIKSEAEKEKWQPKLIIRRILAAKNQGKGQEAVADCNFFLKSFPHHERA